MARVVDSLAIALLVVAAGAFMLGLRSLGDRDDLYALYLLVLGAAALRASTDLLRPRSAS